MPLRSSLRTTLKDFLTIRYTPSSPTLPPQASKYKLVIINFGGTLFETDDANVQELLPQLNTTPIPHLGAMDLLIGLQQRGIPVVISSSNNNNTTNRAIPVIFEAMDRFRLSEYVRGDLIVGDLHGDDAREYTEVILPRLKNIYGEEWTQKSGEVLVVGGTGTDCKFARGIGARFCWGRFVKGEYEVVMCKGDFLVERLLDVLGVVDL